MTAQKKSKPIWSHGVDVEELGIEVVWTPPRRTQEAHIRTQAWSQLQEVSHYKVYPIFHSVHLWGKSISI